MVVAETSSASRAGALWRKARTLAREAALRLRMRRDREPIETVEALNRFACTRAAFVAQKKLYGYLKARMGTRYPSMFEDDVFVESINVAKRQVFAACLSDITVHTVARVVAAGGLDGEAGRRLAMECHQAGLSANRDDLQDEALLAEWRTAFAERVAAVHWENAAAGGDSFTHSPGALYQWAPIDESLKRYDREIVENSIRFAWVEVIRDFRKRAAPGAIAEDFRAAPGKEQS